MRAITTTRARSWHHFFPEWLATLRFSSGKKDPTLGPPEHCRACERDAYRTK